MPKPMTARRHGGESHFGEKCSSGSAPAQLWGAGKTCRKLGGCACEIGIGPIFQAATFVDGAARALAPPSGNGARSPMNIQTTPHRSGFGIGEPVLRTEDPKLLRGQGRYTDDINLPRQAHAFIVRSTVAHGRIKSIGTAAAKAMPGVLGVYTGEDLKAYGTLQSALPFKSKDGSDLKKPPRAGAADRQGALRRRSDRLRGGGDAAAGQGRRRGDRDRHRAAAGRDHARSRRPRRARPPCSTTCRATSASTSTTATPRRSTPRSPPPRTRSSSS